MDDLRFFLLILGITLVSPGMYGLYGKEGGWLAALHGFLFWQLAICVWYLRKWHRINIISKMNVIATMASAGRFFLLSFEVWITPEYYPHLLWLCTIYLLLFPLIWKSAG